MNHTLDAAALNASDEDWPQGFDICAENAEQKELQDNFDICAENVNQQEAERVCTLSRAADGNEDEEHKIA